MAHCRGSFRSDWDDLLKHFVQRRKNDERSEELLDEAQAEAAQSGLCDRPDAHQLLQERSNR